MHSSFPLSEASVLIDLTTKSTKKFLLAPLAIAAIHVASFDSLFTTLELSVLKPWLVGQTCE